MFTGITDLHTGKILLVVKVMYYNIRAQDSETILSMTVQGLASHLCSLPSTRPAKHMVAKSSTHSN